MKPRGVFITATDTGAGKTYVACAIARALASTGRDVGVFKPVCSGGRADARSLIAASRSGDALDEVNPVTFARPIAPLAAARAEGRQADVGAIRRSFRTLIGRHTFLIVEGAGGILVPITPRVMMLDLIREFALPAIVVARPGLGTINHTLLTVERLRREGISVAGVVLSLWRGRGQSERTNPDLIRKLGSVPVLTLGPGAVFSRADALRITGLR